MRASKNAAAIMSLYFMILFTACSKAAPDVADPAGGAAADVKEAVDISNNDKLAAYQGMTPEEICALLTLEQKAAQMMEPTIYHVEPEVMSETDYGSILSKYDIWPMPGSEKWRSTVTEYQTNALSSEASIPFVYGNDSLHGVNFASGCVIFPHNDNPCRKD